MLRKIALACAMTSTLLVSACAVNGTTGAQDGALKLEGRTFAWNGAPKKAIVTPTLHFGTDMRVNGLAGCNNFMAGYKLEGDKLSFTNAATTMKLCDKDSMEVEQAWLKVLNGTKGVRESDKGLELLGEKGETLATLTPVEKK